MKYDPDKHHRRSIRLREYDYREPGAYFVTICTFGKECILGSIHDGEVTRSSVGRIVEQCLLALPQLFPHIELDAFIIMPNHLHVIIIIREMECRGEASSTAKAHGTTSGSLASVIQNFKSTTTRHINRVKSSSGPFWQRGYYEHVIRNDKSLDETRNYINSNPWNRHLDEYNCRCID